MIVCPRCGAQNPPGVALCARCSTPLNAPLPQQPQPQYSDPLANIIPTKNGAALTAYYLGLFSIFPILGLPMAIIALVQGLKGFRLSRDTKIPGKAHAGIGIGCGSIGLLLNLGILYILAMVFLEEARKNSGH